MNIRDGEDGTLKNGGVLQPFILAELQRRCVPRWYDVSSNDGHHRLYHGMGDEKRTVHHNSHLISRRSIVYLAG